jgi:hypothetical protein
MNILKKINKNQDSMISDIDIILRRLTNIETMLEGRVSELSKDTTTGNPLLDNPVIMEHCYGVCLDTTQGPSAKLIRIGNQKLHETMPVHQKLEQVIIDGQHMVKVPPFYFAQFFHNEKYYWLVSDQSLIGMEIHPWFLYKKDIYNQYFGSFKASIDQKGKLSSIPVDGFKAAGSLTRAAFRESAQKRGDWWYQQSFIARSAILLLYMIERAEIDPLNDPNNNSFHGINDLFTGKWEFIDGINILDNKPYICVDHLLFADDTTTHYPSLGHTLPTEDGWVNSILNTKYGMFPTTIASTRDKSLFKFRYWEYKGWRVLLSGSCLYYGADDGLAAFAAYNDSSGADVDFGSRLCKMGEFVKRVRKEEIA